MGKAKSRNRGRGRGGGGGGGGGGSGSGSGGGGGGADDGDDVEGREGGPKRARPETTEGRVERAVEAYFNSIAFEDFGQPIPLGILTSGVKGYADNNDHRSEVTNDAVRARALALN